MIDILERWKAELLRATRGKAHEETVAFIDKLIEEERKNVAKMESLHLHNKGDD